MSAALLAMDHFNNRNSSIVPELANYTNCNVRFDVNASRVLDTGSITHLASESFWQQDIVPCAIAGPFNDIPAIDLSVMALSAKVPLVAHRTHSIRVTSDVLSPFSSQTFPGTLSSAHKLVEFLLHKGRRDYIGVMYSLSETGIQRQESLAVELDHSRVVWMSAGYSLGASNQQGEEYDELDCENDNHDDEHDHGRADDKCENEHRRRRQVVVSNLTFDEVDDGGSGNVTDEGHDMDHDTHYNEGENHNATDNNHEDESHHADEEHEESGNDHGHDHGHDHGSEGGDHGEHDDDIHFNEHSPFGALRKIKESGYRTVVVSMEFPEEALPLIADAAQALGMNQGDYLWVWDGMFEPSLAHSKNSNITKLLAGSALLMPYSNAFLDPENDPFAKAYHSQGKDAVDRLNADNPIAPGEPGYIFAEDDWFQSAMLEWGAGTFSLWHELPFSAFYLCYGSSAYIIVDFLFDAVMAVGIGACMAEEVSNETISSRDHQNRIREAVFTGATGVVAFGGKREDEIGGRDPATVSWAEINVLPPQAKGNETVYVQISGIYTPETKHWHHVAPFVYRDGRTVPPELLRDEPDQNYLSRGLRIMGYALMGIALIGAAVCALWVFLRRKHRVLRASQPVFLYLVALGASIEALTILTISNDESYGWSTESLSHLCMANPWLLSTGHIIIYSALFSKLWRVNKVLQFSRRKIEVRHVAGPMILIVTLALLVLSLWTALDPLIWTRVEIDDVTGESIGQCNSEHFAAYIIPLIILMMIPTCLTAMMAWKTMDVDEAYAESKWIFSMILVQLEIVVVAVPVIFILRDVSTDGRYLGFMFLLWIFPMSTLLFIFLPKYLAYRNYKPGGQGKTAKRGQRNGVVVSGSVASSHLRSRPPSSLEETFVHGEPESGGSVRRSSGIGSRRSETSIPEEESGDDECEPPVPEEKPSGNEEGEAPISEKASNGVNEDTSSGVERGGGESNASSHQQRETHSSSVGGIASLATDEMPSSDVFEDENSDSENGEP